MTDIRSFFNCQKLILQTTTTTNNNNNNNIHKVLEGEHLLRCVLQSISLGQRKLFNKGNLFFLFVWYITNVWSKWSVAVMPSRTLLSHEYWNRPRGLAWARVSSNPTLTQPSWGVGFSSRRFSRIQIFKGFTFITPQDSINKVADVCGIQNWTFIYSLTIIILEISKDSFL